MYRKCCCGGTVCEILVDNFNRADSTNLGSDWTETSGSWSIASNQLSGNGLCLTVPERADSSVYYTVSAYIQWLGRLYFDADGAGNYHYIENGRSGTFLSFGNQSGVIADYTLVNTSTDRDIKVCVDGSTLYINYYDNSFTNLKVRTFTPNDGLKAGLGSAFSRVYDNFEYKVHTAGCSECTGEEAECSSGCCSEQPPADIVIDLGTSFLSNSGCSTCTGIAGEYTLSAIGDCIWYYEEAMSCTMCNGNDGPTCIGDSLLRMTLTLGVCAWELRIEYGDDFGITNPDCGTGGDIGCRTDEAIYKLTMSNPTNCATLDDSMTKFSTSGSNACTGTWPTTIGIAAV